MHDCDVLINSRRALRRPRHRQAQRVLAELEEDPHRHRPVARSTRTCASTCRSSAMRGEALEGPDRRLAEDSSRSTDQKALQGLVAADRRVARARLPAPTSRRTRHHQAAIRARAALCTDIKDRDHYITTEVGQHQMWAAQFLKFEKPNHWMTSGGLGTMGYGLPAAMGVQIAHPDALVIDIAGEASILMNIQEMSTVGAVPAAGEGLHPQQPVHGHGAPVAGAAAWRPLFRELHPRRCPISSSWPTRSARSGCAVERAGRARRRDPAR